MGKRSKIADERRQYRVDWRSPASLRPYERNSRTHSQAQIEQIVASIREFGFTNPNLIDPDGVIIAGEGRWKASNKMGLETVPTITLGHLTPAQRRAYVITDNRLALNAGWDEKLLAMELSELKTLGYDVGLTGFEPGEIESLFDGLGESRAGLTPDDQVPDVPERPVTRPGDVFLMGDHRIMCGDSTSAADFGKLMAGRQADLCVTSPPYNVGIKYRGYKDKAARDQYLAFIGQVATRVFEALAPGRFIAWNIGVSPKTFPARQVVALKDVGFAFYRQIVWEKSGVPYPIFPSTMKTKRDRHYKPNYTHEAILFLEKGGGQNDEPVAQCPLCDGDGKIPGRELWCSSGHDQVALLTKGQPELGNPIAPAPKYSSDVWKIHQSTATVDLKTIETVSSGLEQRGKRSHMVKEHPAAFPVELPRVCIGFLTAKGEVVIDPFGGSGSTIIAAEKMGRAAYAMELEPAYVDVAVTRWQNFTGKQAVLADGRPFAELAKERREAA